MTGALEPVRDILPHRRGDEDLLHARRDIGERGPPMSVEFGEDVVEQQHRLDPVGAEQLERPEPQREGERPRLAVAREALGRLVTEAQDEIVTVRPHEGLAPVDLLPAPPAELGEQHRLDQIGVGQLGLVRGALHAEPIGHGGGPRLRCQAAVGLDDEGPQPPDQIHPPGDDPRPQPGQSAVPHVERVEHRGGVLAPPAPQRPGGRLEQRRALAQDRGVLAEVAAERRAPLHHQLVQESTALGGLSPDQGQILGREEHGLDHAEDVPEPPARRGVEAGPVGAAGVESQFHGEFAPGVMGEGAYQRRVRPAPDQGRIRGDPVGSERGQHPDRLEDVGLSVTVASHEGGDPRSELQLQQGPGAEVEKPQMTQVHTGSGGGSGQPGSRTGMSR